MKFSYLTARHIAFASHISFIAYQINKRFPASPTRKSSREDEPAATFSRCASRMTRVLDLRSSRERIRERVTGAILRLTIGVQVRERIYMANMRLLTVRRRLIGLHKRERYYGSSALPYIRDGGGYGDGGGGFARSRPIRSHKRAHLV